MHEPVLLKEVLTLLEPEAGQVVVDATLGSGGHAREILKGIGGRGRLIGIDQDPEAILRAKQNLKDFPQVEYIQANFSQLPHILKCLNIDTVNAVILDVGVSREQLEEAERGFSFLKEGPLDMRMDPTRQLRARDLVNDLSQGELEKLFRMYGEERWAKRIAATLCREREREPIETTTELVHVIQKAVPKPFHFGARHPATRVFQALRIRVNEELKALEDILARVLPMLHSGGRLAVISFHSLEDRIVKQTFRVWARNGDVRLLTRRPIRPTEEEMQRNPRSRSAKLRGVEKVSKDMRKSWDEGRKN